jgi:hypothetical protein
LAPASVLASYASSAQLYYACGFQSAAALAATEIHRLKIRPSSLISDDGRIFYY